MKTCVRFFCISMVLICSCEQVEKGEYIPREIGEKHILWDRFQDIEKRLTELEATTKTQKKQFEILTGFQELVARSLVDKCQEKGTSAKEKEEIEIPVKDAEYWKKKNWALDSRVNLLDKIVRRIFAGGDVSPYDESSPPSIDGEVLGVSKNNNLIVINVGEADGVKKGYEFYIYRERTYVTKIVIVNVFKKQAVRCWNTQNFAGVRGLLPRSMFLPLGFIGESAKNSEFRRPLPPAIARVRLFLEGTKAGMLFHQRFFRRNSTKLRHREERRRRGDLFPALKAKGSQGI